MEDGNTRDGAHGIGVSWEGTRMGRAYAVGGERMFSIESGKIRDVYARD